MTLIIPGFFAHQPLRLRDTEDRHADALLPPNALQDAYFDDKLDRDIFTAVAARCYFPATRLLLELVTAPPEAGHPHHEKPFKCALGLSGTLLLQAERYVPELLDLWKSLADTGRVEFTAGPYYHSLASLFDDTRREFREQITLHRDTIRRHFGVTPTVFRNTEMLHNNAIADAVQDMGFSALLTEGADWLMAGWRSPDFAYRTPGGLPVLLRNYRLSDDIGLRFGSKTWSGYPLTADKYAGWLAANTDPLVLLAMDFETFGEHINADTGIFDFLRALPSCTAAYPLLEYATPSEAVARVPAAGEIDVPVMATISSADGERDTSAFLGNEMQQFCYEELKRMEPAVRATQNAELLHTWRLMLTTDHLAAISSKSLSNGDLRQHYSAYGSIVDAFVRMQTAIHDFKRRAAAFNPPAPPTP